MSAPASASISSVWVRVVTGSRTVVVPLADNPARRMADFTCALATFEVQSLPEGPFDHHAAFKPWRIQALALKAICRLYSDSSCSWCDFAYEYEQEKLAIDVINGGPLLRQWVDDAAATPQDLDALAMKDERGWERERAGQLRYGLANGPSSRFSAVAVRRLIAQLRTFPASLQISRRANCGNSRSWSWLCENEIRFGCHAERKTDFYVFLLSA